MVHFFDTPHVKLTTSRRKRWCQHHEKCSIIRKTAPSGYRLTPIQFFAPKGRYVLCWSTLLPNLVMWAFLLWILWRGVESAPTVLGSQKQRLTQIYFTETARCQHLSIQRPWRGWQEREENWQGPGPAYECNCVCACVCLYACIFDLESVTWRPHMGQRTTT